MFSAIPHESLPERAPVMRHMLRQLSGAQAARRMDLATQAKL